MASCIQGDAALAASYDVYVVGGRRESSRLYFDLPYALCPMPYAFDFVEINDDNTSSAFS